jgi:hypothetical protein
MDNITVPTFEPFEREVHFSNIQEFCSYITEDTIHHIAKTILLLLFEEIGLISIYSENYAKHINTLCGRKVGYF